MKIRIQALVVLAAHSLLALACGDQVGVTEKSEVKIKQGQYFQAQDQQYRYQVAILNCSRQPSGLSELLDRGVCWRTCTGTILKSNKILTAAHCNANNTSTYVASYSGSTLDGRSWKVGNVSYPYNTSPSNWRDNQGNGYLHDLAMLHLSTEIPLGSTQLAAQLGTQNPEGLQAYISGSGFHENTDNVGYYLKWREVNISAVDILNQKLTLNQDFVDSGDSGSGIFTYNGSQAVVHGVLSSHAELWPLDYTYYTYTGFAHYTWILSQL